jgi:DNA primase catalytic subunit
MQEALAKYFDVALLLEFFRLAGPLACREWAFFNAKHGDRETYMVRYMSIGRPTDFGAYVGAQRTVRVEVGAIYKNSMISTPADDLDRRKAACNEAERSHLSELRSRARKTQDTNPFVAKELVFDIDADDYDADKLRRCDCPGNKSVCDECWPIIIASARILDTILRHQFGFQHMLWVFSGRRGLHCWATGSDVAVLSQEARVAVVACVQSFFDPAAEWQSIVCPEIAESLARIVGRAWDSLAARHGWAAYDNVWERARVLRPRVDEAVTTATSHLIKSPFSPHPATRRLALPFDLWSEHAVASVDAISPPIGTDACDERFEDARRHMREFVVSARRPK